MPDRGDRYTKVPFFMHMPLTYFMVRQLYRFEVRCRGCRHHARIYLTTLLNRHTSDTPLKAVALKCTRCKSRDCAIEPDINYKPEGNVIRFPTRPG